MTKPHKATPEQWEIVTGKFGAMVPVLVELIASCVHELRDRIALLEATQHAHADASRMSDAEREQFYAELARPARIEALKTAASAPPDHLRGAPEMVASTEPIEDRAALLWVLWHHQGAGSPIGQPIRRQLGMGRHDKLSLEQYAAARRFASLGEADAEQSPAAPAPAGGLVAKVTDAVVYGIEISDESGAIDAILAVAEWFDAIGYGATASILRQELQRHD